VETEAVEQIRRDPAVLPGGSQSHN